MKQSVFILICLAILLSCNTSDTTKVSQEKTTKLQGDTALVKTERQSFIEALKQLEAVFATNDKEKIADLFSFPLSNEVLGIYVEDSAFNALLNQNNNTVTRAMFTGYFSTVAQSLQIDQINQLFKNVAIDKLSGNDTLEYKAILKTAPCYHYYEVKIENDLVTLTVGTNSNPDFKFQHALEDEIPENDSAICEHALWWIFRFDGKKLHFKEISGAG